MISLTKKYSLLIVIFACSLSIPYLLYTIGAIPIYYDVSRPYQYPPMVKYSFKWPAITPFNASTRHHQKDIYKKIDQKYCGKDRCKFLLPITITEQGM